MARNRRAYPGETRSGAATAQAQVEATRAPQPAGIEHAKAAWRPRLHRPRTELHARSAQQGLWTPAPPTNAVEPSWMSRRLDRQKLAPNLDVSHNIYERK